jgi:hypothetical protein
LVVPVPPELEPGYTISKQDLRERLLAWLDDLPGDDSAVVEVSALLPAANDD